MINNKYKTGLTLVELLIVIAIIGLLSGIVVINVNSWRARTRDSQRAADVRTIQNALAMYQNDSDGRYPLCACDIDGSTDCLSVELNSAGVITTVPSDPLHGPYNYYYCSYDLDADCPGSPLSAGTGVPDGTSYTLIFYSETGNVTGHVPGWNFVIP